MCVSSLSGLCCTLRGHRGQRKEEACNYHPSLPCLQLRLNLKLIHIQSRRRQLEKVLKNVRGLAHQPSAANVDWETMIDWWPLYQCWQRLMYWLMHIWTYCMCTVNHTHIQGLSHKPVALVAQVFVYRDSYRLVMWCVCVFSMCTNEFLTANLQTEPLSLTESVIFYSGEQVAWRNRYTFTQLLETTFRSPF